MPRTTDEKLMRSKTVYLTGHGSTYVQCTISEKLNEMKTGEDEDQGNQIEKYFHVYDLKLHWTIWTLNQTKKGIERKMVILDAITIECF